MLRKVDFNPSGIEPWLTPLKVPADQKNTVVPCKICAIKKAGHENFS